MHAEALRLMQSALTRIPPSAGFFAQGFTALDVGSYDVNGSLRPLIEQHGFRYVGLDVRPGANVAIVTDNPYRIPVPNDRFDLVVCANMLHNVEQPWRLFPEMQRVLRPHGLLAVVTVWQWGENRHPKDYWRFMPDGLRFLFDEAGTWQDYETRSSSDGTIIGSGFKC